MSVIQTVSCLQYTALCSGSGIGISCPILGTKLSRTKHYSAIHRTHCIFVYDYKASSDWVRWRDRLMMSPLQPFRGSLLFLQKIQSFLYKCLAQPKFCYWGGMGNKKKINKIKPGDPSIKGVCSGTSCYRVTTLCPCLMSRKYDQKI